MQNINQPGQDTSDSKLGLAAKFGVLLAGLKYLPMLLLKGAGAFKFMWVITMFGSMLVSLYAWALFFGWKFAVLLVISLFIHESGHWIWMKHKHLNPKAPIFVPLVGAFVQFGRMATDHGTRAWVAFAGPFVGGLGAAVMLAIGIGFNSGAFLAAAVIGFSLNLLQMIPAKPLDGGFIAEAISRKLLIPGALILSAVGLLCRSPVFCTIGVISLLASLQPPKAASVVASDYSGSAKTIGELEAEILAQSSLKLKGMTNKTSTSEKQQENGKTSPANASPDSGIANATGKEKIWITAAYMLLLLGLIVGLEQAIVQTANNIDCSKSAEEFIGKLIPNK
ncbi:MAG TPA: site-2 protease family protein [Drouetiella sp.]